MSTKCCTFLPKREFLLQILHCVVELTIFNVNRNFTFACRELKWNIMRSILVLIFVSLLMAVNSQEVRGSPHTHYPHGEIWEDGKKGKNQKKNFGSSPESLKRG